MVDSPDIPPELRTNASDELSREDVRVLLDVFMKADDAGLMGDSCATDPCPYCTAAERAQIFLSTTRSEAQARLEAAESVAAAYFFTAIGNWYETMKAKPLQAGTTTIEVNESGHLACLVMAFWPELARRLTHYDEPTP